MKLSRFAAAMLVVMCAANLYGRNALLEIDLTPGFTRHVRMELPAATEVPAGYPDLRPVLSETTGCPEKSFSAGEGGIWTADCDYASIMRPPLLYDLVLRPSALQIFLQQVDLNGLRIVVRHREAAFSTIPAAWTMENTGGIVERSTVLDAGTDWPDVKLEVGYRWQDLPATLEQFWPAVLGAVLVLLWPVVSPLRFGAVRYWGSVSALALMFVLAQICGLSAWIDAVGHHPAGLIVSWVALIVATLLIRSVGRWGARGIKHPIQCWMPPVTDKLLLLVAPALMVGVFAVAPSSLLVVDLSVLAVSCCAIVAGDPLRRLLRGPVKSLTPEELKRLFGPVEDRTLEKMSKLPGIPRRLWKDASRDEIRAYIAWAVARTRAPAAEGSTQWIAFLMAVFAGSAALIFLIAIGRIPSAWIGWSLGPLTLAGGIYYSNWRRSRDRKILRDAKRILGSAEPIEQLATRLRGFWTRPLAPATATETVHQS